jgi:MFS family permease
MAVSIVFFFPPSLLWTLGLIAGSFLAGGCVAGWGFFLKSSTPENERIKTVADLLILSNFLMILCNIVAIHISPLVGLVLSMLMLLGAFLLALKLPADNNVESSDSAEPEKNYISIKWTIMFLCLFIVVITINSGLMYQVVSPAFAHLESLTSWYWALPYIIAIYIMRNLPGTVSRTYILYAAIAMIGLSFIGFMILGRSVASYITVNTLMLGAFGVYDLFWWSILGEMLDFHKNPAQVFGFGLSANVLGILVGGMIGKAILSADMNSPNPHPAGAYCSLCDACSSASFT